MAKSGKEKGQKGTAEEEKEGATNFGVFFGSKK